MNKSSHSIRREIKEDGNLIWLESDAELRIRLLEMISKDSTNVSIVVCECGTEKHGFANHSTWCPKVSV